MDIDNLERSGAVCAADKNLSASRVYAPESWLQPPIALYVPGSMYVPGSIPAAWQQVQGLRVCSSTAPDFFAHDDLQAEFTTWTKLGAEAIFAFERSLDE